MNEQHGIGRRPLAGMAMAGLAAAALPGRAARAQAETLADTTLGRLRGAAGDGVRVFRGVRYGASTAGAGRFLPPRPVEPWAGVRDALAFGASAPQVPSTALGELDHWYAAVEPLDEDCLFLNVWTPALDGARRPVMVWLHGGGWTNCAGTAPGFDGTVLARNGDVVVVTVNHRLNVFGSLALDVAADSPFADSGNVGVLDMVAALRWVRDNAAAFGGDPGRVTIFGQSGGSSKVAALMAMPAARGLFHRAIMQSCSGGIRLCEPAEAAGQARDLAAALGLDRLDAQALQQVPTDKLTAAAARVRTSFRPVLDGRSFTAHPFDPAAPALSTAIPLMIGNAATEATLFMAVDPANFTLGAEEVLRRVGRFLRLGPAAARRMLDAYQTALPTARPSELLAAVATDYMYRRNTTEAAVRQAAQADAPVYAYVFDWKTPIRDGVLHSPHTIEVPFAFGTAPACAGLLGTGPELAAVTAQTLPRWAAFAHAGSPDVPGLAAWPRFEPAGRATMMLGLDSHAANNPGGAARAAMDGLRFYDYNIGSNYVRPEPPPSAPETPGRAGR